MPKMQYTIKENIIFSDVGIHTGVTTNMTLKPAKENTGINFIRTDLKGNPVIKADIDNVFATDRSTSLKKGSAEIHTVEHILAAVSGNEIDNLIIEIDNIYLKNDWESAKLDSDDDYSFLNQTIEIKLHTVSLNKAKL